MAMELAQMEGPTCAHPENLPNQRYHIRGLLYTLSWVCDVVLFTGNLQEDACISFPRAPFSGRARLLVSVGQLLARTKQSEIVHTSLRKGDILERISLYPRLRLGEVPQGRRGPRVATASSFPMT